MEIAKPEGQYNTYAIKLSFGELVAIENAMADSHSGPIADEVWGAIQFYLNNLPRPGESKDDLKAREGGDDAEAGDIDQHITDPDKDPSTFEAPELGGETGEEDDFGGGDEDAEVDPIEAEYGLGDPDNVLQGHFGDEGGEEEDELAA